MSTPPAPVTTVAPNVFPLTFSAHAFGAYCYSTIRCRVVYHDQVMDRDHAAPPRGADAPRGWSPLELGIANFPPPAQVSWTSIDGVDHEATVDIATIFADRKVIHHVPQGEIPDGWAHDIRPVIYLEVDDRTINVYMKSRIATKHEQVPGNRYSDYREELNLAWTRTY